MNAPLSITPSLPSSGAQTATETLPGSTPLLAEIYVYVGQELSAKYAIEHGEYLIGRDSGCNIPIEAERVSRHHARLIFSAYEVVIEDLESSNGVFIDGVQLQLPTRVYPDQEVQIGGARIFIHLNADSTKQLRDALWDADLGLAPVRQQLEGSRYRVLTTIARGGMGVVLQARDLRVRRTVAMKVMKSGAQFSRENVLRFIDEAQLTGQLDHPNIVPVYELGIDDRGETFYTMKFVKGITLDEVLRGLRRGRPEMVEKYPLATLLTVFQKVCDAVAFAHAKGVIHRDLKPENVMLGSYGEVLVMDWGLAKQTAGPNRTEKPVEAPRPVQPRHPQRAFETMHGVVVGTPPFVSPEQARGELDAVDVRSDVYVLGAILYTILTLRAPVEGLSMDETLNRIIAGAIRKPLAFNQTMALKAAREEPAAEGEEKENVLLLHCPAQRVPEGLSAIAMKAMAALPEDRYESVVEMQADITAFQGGFATKAERANLWRQALLFGGRHKREFALFLGFALVLQALLVAFIFELSREKNRALANEHRARASESNLAKALDELRGTAPTYVQEAQSLIDDQKLEEALEKIDYAIDQIPNDATYHLLRGHILQSLLRFNEAIAAYNEALARNPSLQSAKDNLALTTKLVSQIGEDGAVTQPILRELHASLVSQKRVGEALVVLDMIGRDRQLFFQTWKAAFEKRNMRQRFETKEDDTLYIDLSKVAQPDLRKIRSAPVSGLSLDDTRLTDISALKGLSLTSLSLNHTLIRDLSPLTGMPLHSLDLESTPVSNLAPLAQMPLEILRMAGTRVESLAALRGLHLEQLNVAGCRGVRDLSPLSGMPLQKLDLSRTSISDLSPLIRSPVRELNLEGCVDLVDLHPLLEMKSLESVLIPAQCKDIEFLRSHPTLKRLSYKKLTEQAYDFWAAHDAQKP